MTKSRIALLILLFSGIFSRTSAQIDTDFWLAAPEVSASLGDQPIGLRIMSYGSAATVTINQPANGGFTPIVVNLGANATQNVNLSAFLASIESPSGNAVNNNGLHISSTADISVFYEIGAASNKEAISLKGEKGLGTEFYTPFQKFWNNGSTTPASFNSIEIVATQNATTVLITPRSAVTGHAVNSTYSITLNAGQTYSARESDLVSTTSLSGSIISSDKPVAVTVYMGAMSNTGCLSTMADQITSSQYIGKDYIIHKGKAINEKVYVLATQNGTSVNVYNSGTATTLINWGEAYEISITDTVNFIQTSKPVYVFHASGNGCKLSGAQVPNLLCAGTYSTAFTRPVTDSFALRLYTRTGFEGQFQLNGNSSLIPSSAFRTVPGTGGNYKSALIFFNTTDIPQNSYNIVTNSGDIFGMGIMYGSSTAGSGFAYLSEFSSYPFVDAGADASVCANVPFSLNGIVGGGSVTGTWSSTGFGSFQNGLTSLTNNYLPNGLDTVVSPIKLILSSTGPCPVQRDTLILTVEPAPIVNASADQTVCGNNAIVNLNGGVTGGATTGIWSTLGNGTFSPQNTDLNADYIASSTDTANGTVILVLTATNIGTCASVSDTMVVTITDVPKADAGPATATACSNNPNISISGTISGTATTGRWTTSGNGIFSPNNLSLNATYTPSVTDVNSGSVTLYLESTNNGICNPAIDSIVVTFTPDPTVNAGVNQIACSNDPSVDLAGVVSGPTTSGIWTGGAGTFSPSSSDLNASYTPTAAEISNGNVILTLTSTSNGNCLAESATMRIDFVAPPFANFNYNNVCLNESNSFTDFSLPGYGSLNTWEWNFGDGNTSTSQDPTHTYLADGSYPVELIVTNTTGCKDTLSQTVTVYPLPVANFSYVPACSGSQVTIDFTDNSTVSSGSINYWYYDFGGLGNIAAQNATQVFTGVGTFYITHIVSTTNGCRDTIVTPITVNPRPSAGFYYNTASGLNVGAEVEFIDTSSNATIFEWEFGDGTGGSTLQDPTHIYFANGLYQITQIVFDNLGCSDTARVYISINTVSNDISTLIPNAISPNGDGKNDVWKLNFISILYPNASVEIFNRWGQKLFSSDGYTTPWDGTFNGEPLPASTYFFVLDLKDPSKPEPITGTILLIR
ncbi:MAG: gliding motility-associated C-terminal domain-containing protein [Flavobacteriales bacterium]|nr:gliding motility-associated C-terminal domain-containing protein [Flavobacteriales bacterium]